MLKARRTGTAAGHAGLVRHDDRDKSEARQQARS